MSFNGHAQVRFEEDCMSFVLTNEGNDRMIERLVAAGCTSLYEALVYLRNHLPGDAPATLTGNMDALITELNKHMGEEVFTAWLTSFTGAGNSPVGINSDGTFTRNDFSVYSYEGHSGYARYSGSELFTYATSPDYYILLGSDEVDLGGGITKTINYKTFAVAWNMEPTTFVLSNEEGGLIDQLIAGGYGTSDLYEALVALQDASGGVISDEFLDNLASNTLNSLIFTKKLNNYAHLNGGIAINTDGTAFTTTSIKGRDYYGDVGYSTFPTAAGASESFTYANSPEYYINAVNGSTTYKVFAIG